MGEHLYMLPSDMNLKIRSGTVGYNNKVLVSNGKFIVGKNDEVNPLETPVMKSHKASNVVTQTAVTHKGLRKKSCDSRTKNNYYPQRRENCFNSFFNWNIYDMVPLSINLFTKTFHAYQISV